MLQIAEMFTSVQGEGTYAGTLMRFIRLAGCNVGRRVNDDDFIVFNQHDVDKLDLGAHTVCTSALGQKFICDTDYRRVESIPVKNLVGMLQGMEDRLPKRICITGGEPLLQQEDLADLMDAVRTHVPRVRRFHIETSGTVAVSPRLHKYARTEVQPLWITCSPKIKVLQEYQPLVNEWKFVYHPREFPVCEFIANVERVIGHSIAPVFVQPISSIGTGVQFSSTDWEQWQLLLEKRPAWRLSIQMHKYLGLR